MAAKRVARGRNPKERPSGLMTRIKMSLTGDDALTITFPASIKDLVTPITKKDGDIPVEFLFVMLEQYVAQRAAAVLEQSTAAPSGPNFLVRRPRGGPPPPGW